MEKLIKYARAHVFLVSVVGVVVVVGAVIAGRVAATKPSNDAPASNVHQVSLVEASSFRTGQSTVFADGTVESISQADLRSQVSAPIAVENVTVGSTVRAGQTIVAFQNADVRAELDRAVASRKLALGQNETGAVSVDAARLGAIDKIKNAYIQADDAVRTNLDPIILNSQVGGDQLSSYTTDWRLTQDISTERGILTSTFADWKKNIDSLGNTSSNADVEASLQISQNALKIVNDLLDKTSLALSDAAKTVSGTHAATVGGWKTTVVALRTSISATVATLTSADTALTASETSNGTSAVAGVDLADAGVKSLEAQLAKTYITSPINGKIAALPFRVGELVSPGQLVATVVGSGGLEVKAYASSEDFSKIKQGSSVMVENSIPGTLANIAPSLNETNKKIELTVLINDPTTAGLVVGQDVTVAIESASTTASTATAPSTADASYFLPIQDVKIIPGSASVFTVDENSKIQDNPVILGAVRGDFIEVKSGITDDMKIVSPVYEINPGETVKVR